MRVLVIGRTGQIASELLPRLAAAGHEAVALEPPEFDMTRADHIAAAFDRVRPQALVNCAAYTAVDKAEDDRALAFAVNATGPGLLGRAARRADIPVVHYSTDYVFDGSKPEPYVETDAPDPVGAYGASKLAGEMLLHDAQPRSVTLRTAWVCSPHGGNFVKTMLRFGKERPELRVVADQHGAPTFAADLAAAAMALLPRLVDSRAGDAVFGITHLTGAPYTTWHGFAEAIFAGAARRGQPAPKVTAITTDEYPTKARRPANSRLDCTRAATVLGIPPADWRAGLERCLDDLLAQQLPNSGSACPATPGPAAGPAAMKDPTR
ncbi:dTDP-4-dehydrorhamnose reductase [Paracraurococcus ruber]|uniref:dTDP-4-dehydrorhamnose reductase n=1 Tax=Paracraurococcus ruber TaxID=77675 RepID=A0ABS1D157_9PROT|nr:dTDP-4-dehydrorhamnose reductase [Paracraurococcus ruber]MBK1660539.1 dTDP-4-dehydrorhamnose reductase [Paracraurococcus ruber]TDG27383.1 dTDP-4-dehydrorhamnose reductase [Paracraurococcus ruber]